MVFDIVSGLWLRYWLRICIDEKKILFCCPPICRNLTIRHGYLCMLKPIKPSPCIKVRHIFSLDRYKEKVINIQRSINVNTESRRTTPNV